MIHQVDGQRQQQSQHRHDHRLGFAAAYQAQPGQRQQDRRTQQHQQQRFARMVGACGEVSLKILVGLQHALGQVGQQTARTEAAEAAFAGKSYVETADLDLQNHKVQPAAQQAHTGSLGKTAAKLTHGQFRRAVQQQRHDNDAGSKTDPRLVTAQPQGEAKDRQNKIQPAGACQYQIGGQRRHQHAEAVAVAHTDHKILFNHRGRHDQGQGRQYQRNLAADFPQIGQQQHGGCRADRIEGHKHRRHDNVAADGAEVAHQPPPDGKCPALVPVVVEAFIGAVRAGIAVQNEQCVAQKHAQQCGFQHKTRITAESGRAGGPLFFFLPEPDRHGIHFLVL